MPALRDSHPGHQPTSSSHLIFPPHLPLHWHTSFQVHTPHSYKFCKLFILLDQEMSGLLVQAPKGHILLVSHTTLPVGFGRTRGGEVLLEVEGKQFKSLFSSLRKVLQIINTVGFCSLFFTLPLLSTSFHFFFHSSFHSLLCCMTPFAGAVSLVFVLNNSW